MFSLSTAKPASRLMLFAILVALSSCVHTLETGGSTTLCTPQWYSAVEANVGTGDGAGHGPDPGSEEWRSTVEFRLGVRGSSEVPGRKSVEWCEYIDQLIF